MFEFQLENNEKHKLPVNTTNTEDIYHYLNSAFSLDNQNSIISFNYIFLSKNFSYNLLEIGYSPNSILKVSHSDTKEAFFNIIGFNYQYCLPIDEYSSTFTMKEYFAEQFFTVSQNIIIKQNNKILNDHILLHKLVLDQRSPFEVTTGEDYFLVHTYSEKFNFICCHKDSTIGNLKDTISIYTTQSKTIDSQYTYTQKMLDTFKKKKLSDLESIDNTKIQTLSSKIPLFEFKIQKEQQNPNYQYKIKIVDKIVGKKTTEFCSFTSRPNIYRIICVLEKNLKIDRSLFTPTNKKGEKLDFNEIDLEKEFKLYFSINKSLKAKVQNELVTFSYLTTIKDIQDQFQFVDHNFGIIINNHYAYQSSDKGKYLLIHFMNNSDESPTEIYISKAKEKCQLRTFTKLSQNQKKSNKKFFIIPIKMPIQEQTKIYLHMNYNSIEIISQSSDEIVYRDSYKTTISYTFNVKSFNIRHLFSSFHQEPRCVIEKAEVEGWNPRIIDLLLEVNNNHPTHKYLIDHVFKSRDVIQASFNGEQLPFYEPLSNIFDDENHHVQIDIISENCNACVYILSNSSFQEEHIDYYSNKELMSASQIIKNVCKSADPNIKLYVDFNELKPGDKPSIYKQIHPFIIINDIKESKKFTIMNDSSLSCTLEISRNNYQNLAEMIAGMFSLQLEEIKFKTKINGKPIDLPKKFDAGSLPCDSTIMIDYNNVVSNKVTFRYGKTKTITINDCHKEIGSHIPLIQKELGIFNISKNALQFTFHDSVILPSRSLVSYKIPAGAVITIRPKSRGVVTVKVASIENPTKSDIYIFSADDRIKDVKELFKLQFGRDVEFTIDDKEESYLEDTVDLGDDMPLFVHSEKVKVTYETETETKQFEITDILTVSDAVEYLRKQTNHMLIHIFSKNTEENCYDAVDCKKRLFELKGQLYAHKYWPKIQFTNYVIFTEKEHISEFNTVGWLKKRFISKVTLFDPDKIKIVKDRNGRKFKDEILIRNLHNSKEKLRIEFQPEEEQKKPSKKAFMPKISAVDTPKSNTVPYRRKRKNKKLEPKQIEEEEENESDSESDDSYSFSSSSSDDDDDANGNGNDENVDQIVIEEEETDEYEEEGESLCTYKFQISKDPVCEMSFKEDATIEDAKIKIAKENGDIDPSCVSILFAGKVLRKDIQIKDLNLISTDILQVFIRSTEDILLRTARALRVYGQADIEEYYSEYEDE